MIFASVSGPQSSVSSASCQHRQYATSAKSGRARLRRGRLCKWTRLRAEALVRANGRDGARPSKELLKRSFLTIPSTTRYRAVWLSAAARERRTRKQRYMVVPCIALLPAARFSRLPACAFGYPDGLADNRVRATHRTLCVLSGVDPLESPSHSASVDLVTPPRCCLSA